MWEARRSWAAAAMLAAALVLGLLAWRAAAARPADPLREWRAGASEPAAAWGVGLEGGDAGGGAAGEAGRAAGGGAAGAGEGAAGGLATGGTSSGIPFGPYAGWQAMPSEGGAAVVHVAGAVREPGVYVLPAGARVWDAVEAAGGAAADAQLAAVNLAAPVADGDQVYIPRKGESAGGGSGAAGGAARGGGGSGAGGSGPASGKVDVNRAGPEALEALPGIGPELARRIVEERETHGPFRSVDDLSRVSGIGPKKLEALRPFVVIR